MGAKKFSSNIQIFSYLDTPFAAAVDGQRHGGGVGAGVGERAGNGCGGSQGGGGRYGRPGFGGADAGAGAAVVVDKALDFLAGQLGAGNDLLVHHWLDPVVDEAWSDLLGRYQSHVLLAHPVQVLFQEQKVSRVRLVAHLDEVAHERNEAQEEVYGDIEQIEQLQVEWQPVVQLAGLPQEAERPVGRHQRADNWHKSHDIGPAKLDSHELEPHIVPVSALSHHIEHSFVVGRQALRHSASDFFVQRLAGFFIYMDRNILVERVLHAEFVPLVILEQSVGDELDYKRRHDEQVHLDCCLRWCVQDRSVSKPSALIVSVQSAM